MAFSIDQKSAIKVLREYPTEGHRPLQVMTHDYQFYVVKSAKGQVPPLAIQNEILCHFFLRAWNILTPDIALIEMRPDQTQGHLSGHNKPNYYDGLMFGSKLINNAIEVNQLFLSDFKRHHIYNPIELLKIALFDIWIENDDRKPSNFNLLLIEDAETRNLRFCAIDHAFVFASMKHLDLQADLGVCQSYNDSILFHEGLLNWCATYVSDGFLNVFQRLFQRLVQHCKEIFPSIVALLPPELGLGLDSQQHISDFLFDEKRNRIVFEEFTDRF
jgi:hypothetical protein